MTLAKPTPLKVLIVDDSPVFRKVLAGVIEEDPRFQVAGRLRNGREAIEALPELRPDAVVLDVEMPVMNGLETLQAMQEGHSGLPVIMFSSLTNAGAEITFRALELGAFDFLPKPESASIQDSLDSVRRDLIPKLVFLHTRQTLRRITEAGPQRPVAPAAPRKAAGKAAPAVETPSAGAESLPQRQIVAVGISTGGPRALARMVPQLSANLETGMLIVQHMPPVFTEALAQRLNDLTPLDVKEAGDGEFVEPGKVLVAPGGRHMTVSRYTGAANRVVIRLNDRPPVNNCRPSVDVLFQSVAEVYGPQAVGVIMTGMGSDGSDGLREMKRRGAWVIAQNEATCTVFGMPRKPVEEGMADEVLPLDEIAAGIARAVTSRKK